MASEHLTLTPVLRADEWFAVPAGYGHLSIRIADRRAVILAHIGPVDTPPTLAEQLIFVCPVALSVASIPPERTVYLRTERCSMPVQLDLAPIGAPVAQFGPSPFTGSDEGVAPRGIVNIGR